MVMMGIEFADDIPFDDVYVHSVIQAPDGRRMSKSLGTGIDPLELIDSHGADGVRFGLLAMSSTQDVRFTEDKITQGQQLANKLFNASRLVLMRVGDDAIVPDAAPDPELLEDRWILSRLAAAKEETASAIEAYEFHRAVLGLYDFVYGELCDWYLEWIKPRLYGEGEPVADVALHVLAETVAMAHPVIPFVTEEIWSLLPGTEGLLAQSRWPARDASARDAEAEREIAAAIEAVRELRGWRDRVNAAPGAVLPARIRGFEQTREAIARLARLDLDADGGDVAATLVAGAVDVLACDAIDLEADARRTDAERKRLTAELERVQSKLDGPFASRAPADKVAAEREKLARLKAELEALE